MGDKYFWLIDSVLFRAVTSEHYIKFDNLVIMCISRLGRRFFCFCN